ncbi:FecR family protein [Alkalispirochaeta americana]|uniref:FecR family protein n=1 Tax=Alkalispirochaeta americana TaxID=159291 RepID=A0A1N6V7R6_9SPIO|nr:FecR family protein [Alkalispirochaeta americana]SIQ73944.1 FecR family protein [Alkalispirochaeta americana]
MNKILYTTRPSKPFLSSLRFSRWLRPVRPSRAVKGLLLPGLILGGLLVSSPAVLAESIGRIEYIEGDVALIRDGEILDEFQINPGDPLLEMDVIQTGFDGYAEVLLTAGGRSTVRIQENTAYYIEVEPQTGGGENTRLRLLSGSVEMAVQNVSRNSQVNVETRSAVLGVRGTEFDVLTAPDESTLAGVRAGQVEVSSSGQKVLVDGGSAAEVQQNQAPRSQTVPEGDFDQFYSVWTEARLQAFRSGAPTFIKAYVRRFNDTEPEFQKAYRELMAHRNRLEREASRTGTSLGGDMRLRTEVSPALIKMRSILPLFENTVYRLEELSRFHAQGIGETTIDGVRSGDFFARFSRVEQNLRRQLGEVRTVFRLYRVIEQRSFGGLPEGSGGPFGGGSPINSMGF